MQRPLLTERLDSGLHEYRSATAFINRERDLAAAFVNIKYRCTAASTNRERLDSEKLSSGLYEYRCTAAFINREMYLAATTIGNVRRQLGLQ